MLTATDVLALALRAPELGIPLRQPPSGACCAVTGVALDAGYRVADAVPAAAGEFLDMLHGQTDGWLSESAARLFHGTATWNLGSRLVFEDGTMYWPLIARPKSGERPCWSALAREIWPARRGQRCVAILTTDVKKRLWPMARLGQLDTCTPVTIYDPEQNIRATVQVDWPVMLDMLGVIEAVYTAGFSKRSIRDGLYDDFRRIQELGYRRVREFETTLAPMRGQVEFTMAVLIAQKEEE